MDRVHYDRIPREVRVFRIDAVEAGRRQELLRIRRYSRHTRTAGRTLFCAF